ncbi:sensor histidine kinase [Microbacterium ureisolvens]|uniref:histidine kinase n=1 Tax=Microbacterium ureisolvens TaxID=2781186 RepID=A0ABS7HYM5_9MICO|nr:histidine kinase [Microbacterium ureisolvens]MBW9110163.1 two-component sensor histidine kinase [Microbacterium ureisolvens]
MTATDISPAIGVSPSDAAAELPANVTRILGTRRSALVLASIVFVTTTIQVLAEPLAVLVQGGIEWTLPVSAPVLFSLLVLGCAAQASAFLLADRWPEATVVITTVTYIGLAAGLSVPGWLIGMYLVIALAMFLLATRKSLTVSIVWLVGVVLVVTGALFLWALAIGLTPNVAAGFVTTEAMRLTAPAIAATALGAWWGVQTRRVNLARIQAETAKREHDDRVEEAERKERARIAQELHDVAGQHLAGLITLADGALAIAPARPEEALRLVEEVRNEGRFAAASLAGALTDLRAVGTEPRETTRDLRQAKGLIEYWHKRGMTIQLAASGPVEELPAVVSATAYRCTQEAVTNAAKHAPGSAVDVDINARPDRLEVAITNGSPPSGTAPIAGLGLGWGLSGMRERIDLLRGTLVFGTTPEGGWVVRFVIPVAQPD